MCLQCVNLMCLFAVKHKSNHVLSQLVYTQHTLWITTCVTRTLAPFATTSSELFSKKRRQGDNSLQTAIHLRLDCQGTKL